MNMKKICLIIAAGVLFYSTSALGQEVYRWVDEKGTVHFTDDLGQVPEKYREKIQKEKTPKETPPPPTTSPKGVTAGKAPGQMPAPIQKDSLGRGEEWWRAKALEWNEKFKTAQKNYESTYNEWKSKGQELETSKFIKPDNWKRKLKAEIKVLEEKVKDWERQMDEAKDMVENVLPKQAQDYRANPDWLKLEEKK
jgi:hypothetical protein